MRSCLQIAILTFLALSVSSLAAEFVQNPSDNMTLHHVYFCDELNGWILGSTSSEGFIIQSTDGGQSWHERYRSSEGLFNVNFADQKVGWVIGSNGTILHTSDGGTSWKRQGSGSNVLLTGLAVLDANKAWVTGGSGTLLYTKDGGNTWSKKKINTGVGISHIMFADAQHGWAIGYGIILSTNDGGETWELKSSGDWKPLSTIFFANREMGWITVGPIILRTTDAGNTWRESTPASQGKIAGLSFVKAQQGWVVKSRGEEGSIAHISNHDTLSSESFILSTNDGGITWQEQLHIKSDTDHSAWMLNIFFIDSFKGWAVGRNGLIFKTVNSGKNWSRLPKPFHNQ